MRRLAFDSLIYVVLLACSDDRKVRLRDALILTIPFGEYPNYSSELALTN